MNEAWGENDTRKVPCEVRNSLALSHSLFTPRWSELEPSTKVEHAERFPAQRPGKRGMLYLRLIGTPLGRWAPRNIIGRKERQQRQITGRPSNRRRSAVRCWRGA
jgi:hypothetical protein